MASSFIEAVRERIGHEPGVFNQFGFVLGLYYGKQISGTEAADSLRVLLSGHVDLLQRLERFVPPRPGFVPSHYDVHSDIEF